MWLKITPNDTLFFRTGRPFTAGDDTWTDELFPPNPSTIYGAIRTFLIFFRGNLSDFKNGKYQDIGKPENQLKGTLRIKGPFLYNIRKSSLYFPAPFDLVTEKGSSKEISSNEQKNESCEDGKKKEKLSLLSRVEKPPVYFSDDDLENLFVFAENKQVEEVNFFLEETFVKEYLISSVTHIEVLKPDIYEKEIKIGIAREKITRTSKEGHLYRIPMIRLCKDYSILVEIDGVDQFPEKGVFQLGGEGKTIKFEKVENNSLNSLLNLNFQLKNKMFKIYLATPAIFENGWLPAWINRDNLTGELNGISLKLIACSIGKFTRIGGWDMYRDEPKVMYKAVPAGSVYYFKILNDISAEKIKETFHFKNISDINPEEGFGLTLVGEVK